MHMPSGHRSLYIYLLTSSTWSHVLSVPALLNISWSFADPVCLARTVIVFAVNDAFTYCPIHGLLLPVSEVPIVLNSVPPTALPSTSI